MAVEARLHDGRVLRFPDGTDPAVVQETVKKVLAADQQQPPPEVEAPSTLSDVGTGVTSGAFRGLTNIVGIPGDVAELGAAAGRGIRGLVTGDSSPAERPIGFGSLVAPTEFPTSEEVRTGVQGVIGEVPRPETRLGKFAEAGTEFGVSALPGPGGVAGATARVGIGAATGVGSEAAGQIFEGSDLEPIARLVGGLATGIVTASAVGATRSVAESSRGGGARKALREAAAGVPDEEFARASRLQSQAQSLGVPLTGPEAIQSQPLRQLAGNVAQSPAGGTKLNALLQTRAGQTGSVARAVTSEAANLGPNVSPRIAASTARQGALKVIAGEKAARSNTVRQFYEAAAKQEVLPDDVRPIIDALDDAGKSPAFRATARKIKAELVDKNGKITVNAGALDDTFAKWRDNLNRPPIADPNALSARESGRFGAIIDDLGAMLKSRSDDLRQGRRIFQMITEEVIDPLREAGLDDVARSRSFKTMINAIVDPQRARPGEIRQTLGAIRKEAPEAVPRLARVYIDSAIDRALKDTQAGASTAVGARFKNLIGATPEQRKNLNAVLTEVALSQNLPPKTHVLAWGKMMRVLQRTASIPGAGSPTQSRQALARQLSEGSITAGAADALNITKGSVLSSIGERGREITSSGNYQRLAEIFTAPNSVEAIQTIAKHKPTSIKAQFAIAQLLTASAGPDSASQDQGNGN